LFGKIWIIGTSPVGAGVGITPMPLVGAGVGISWESGFNVPNPGTSHLITGQHWPGTLFFWQYAGNGGYA
jgi:hypothetical protein